MIEWNTEELRSDLIAKSEHHMMYTNGNGCKSEFGILRIEVPAIPISKQPLAILINLDHSGSMDDSCADGRTKMQHIKHTIKNILRVLSAKLEEEPELTIYICINIFSHNVENILQQYIKQHKKKNDTRRTKEMSPEEYGFVLITKQSVKWIMEEVDRIDSWGCTNIELSLKSANEQISTFSEKNPEIRIAHIMLTDGQATIGKTLPEDLKSLVDPYYRNIFVGYGEDHDGHLMSSLGEVAANCEYKVVDSLENTGLVYGEILYSLLYPLFHSPVYLQVSNGAKIYDWHQNTWVSNLVIPPLSGNSEKIFQIVADGTVPTDDIFVHMGKGAESLQQLLTTESTFGAHIRNLDQAKPDLDFAYTPVGWHSQPYRACSSLGVDMDEPNDNCLFDIAMSLPRLICAETGEFKPNDLTQYLLRQLTQEYLYMAREFENERVKQNRPFSQKPMLRRQTAYVDMDDSQHVTIPPELEVIHRQLKNSLLEHFHELSVYHEALPENQFIKVLMDDMHVAIQNMGTQRGLMYTAARQTSQGRQSSYIPSSTLDQDTMKTVDLYGQGPVDTTIIRNNRSINTNTPRDVMSMMTQVQGFDMDMYLSDTESETEGIDALDVDDLSGTGILGHDIGYDQHDVFNADYYYDNYHKTMNSDELDDKDACETTVNNH